MLRPNFSWTPGSTEVPFMGIRGSTALWERGLCSQMATYCELHYAPNQTLSVSSSYADSTSYVLMFKASEVCAGIRWPRGDPECRQDQRQTLWHGLRSILIHRAKAEAMEDLLPSWLLDFSIQNFRKVHYATQATGLCYGGPGLLVS